MSPFNVGLLLVLACFAAGVHGIQHQCKQGETKQVDCNKCSCMGTEKYGFKWGCTKKLCPPPGPKQLVPTRECEPGATKMIKCNSCSCAGTEEAGYRWGCTRKGCGPPVFNH